jgi:CheY-like chemotaxis protein
MDSSKEEKILYFDKSVFRELLVPAIIHEVNNGLSVLQFNLDDINDYLKEKESKDDFLNKKVENQSKAIKKIINSIKKLKFYTVQNTETEEDIDVHELIENSIYLANLIYKKENVEIKKNFSKEKLVIHENAFKLQQNIINFLTDLENSLNNSQKALITIKTETDGKYAIIEILNAGGKNHKMSIPMISNLTLNKIQSSPKTEEMHGRVLIVDDEQDMLNIMKRVISKLGLEVDIASSGEEGLEKLRKNKYRYFITDFKMPFMNGEMLIQKAKELQLFEDTVIFVMTGGLLNEYSEDKKNSLMEGVDGFIQKPFSKDDIFNLLKKFN